MSKRKHPLPTLEELAARFAYCKPLGMFFNLQTIGRARAGCAAGSISVYGYIQIRVSDTTVIHAHRLVWFVETGDWPAGDIDHVNGSRADNRFENLRVATRSQNNANTKRNRNATGFRGVARVRRKCGPDRFSAKMRIGGKQAYLGIFDTPEQAHAAYLAAARREYGEFFAEDGDNVFPELASTDA